MLSNRQLKILDYYLNNSENFIPSKDIAKFFNVSIRTVKNELGQIRQQCQHLTSFELISLPSKGTKLTIHNENQLEKDMNSLKVQQKNSDHAYSNNRVNSIIKFLLDSHSYITKYELMSDFYISETTLYHQINEVKKVLAKFNLTLKYKTNIGYTIQGKELDKRTCITKIGLDYKVEQNDPEDKTGIYNVVADTFIKYKYHVNEETLQNITAHVFRSLQRIKQLHFIETTVGEDLSTTTEFSIADEILASFINKNSIKQQNYWNEVALLTQIILGKLDYVDDDALKEEINHFVDSAFESMHQKFSINFDSIENLRLLLVLHLVPLFYRIKSGTQLVNPLEMKIHKSFPQAYDMSLYFSILIEEHFKLTITNNEISYLALYFNYGIENYLASSKGKRILIISSLRKSETILLRHKILSGFPNQIETIDFIDPQILDQTKTTNNYDAYFTTETSLNGYHDLVPYINLFPDKNDLKKIDLAIKGYSESQDVVNKFSEDCFYVGDVSSKHEVLNIIIENAIKKHKVAKNIYHSVNEREKLSSTYFGNNIAIPHPLTPISDETFVSLALLPEGIKWDDQNNVTIVMLVSIGKDKPKELQFWYYISSFIENKQFSINVLRKPTFDNFIVELKASLNGKFE